MLIWRFMRQAGAQRCYKRCVEAAREAQSLQDDIAAGASMQQQRGRYRRRARCGAAGSAELTRRARLSVSRRRRATRSAESGEKIARCGTGGGSVAGERARRIPYFQY